MEGAVQLTAAHWVYAAFVILIFVTLALRKDTAIVALIGMFILGWILLGSPIGGLQGIFNGMLRSGVVLLDIVFIISVVVSLAKGLESSGAIYLMVQPARKLMRTPALAFWVTGIVMYVAALFLWPSPATALVGAILFPAALAVGLPAISTAMSMNLFGHGACLSTDYVIQGAPKLTAEAAGVPVGDILAASTPLNIVASVVALAVAWFFVVRKDIKNHVVTETEYLKFEEEQAAAEAREYSTMARTAAWLVPLVFLVDVIILIVLEVRGGDATAVLGGTGSCSA
jgi:TRAP-type C4-dicarboxylate transport system permease large subunit